MLARRVRMLMAAGALSACGYSTPGTGIVYRATATATATATPTDTPAPAETPTGTAQPTLVIVITGISGGMSFSPAAAQAAPGQKIRWRNDDTITHDIAANGGAFDTGAIAPGTSSVGITPNEGTYPYHCSIHPSMTGSLTVSN